MSKGYVYCLSNPSMPGIVKIGRSIHGGKGRADALYKNDTGVATPFELEFEIFVNNHEQMEKGLHGTMQWVRVNSSREFFRLSISEACLAVSAYCGTQYGCMPYGQELLMPDDAQFWMCNVVHSYGGTGTVLYSELQNDSDQSGYHTHLMALICHFDKGWVDIEPLPLGDFKITATDKGVADLEEWRSIKNKSTYPIVGQS